MADLYQNLYTGLAAMLRSGVVLERAVHTLRQNGTLKEPMGSALAGTVARGEPLSVALAECAPGVTREELALIEAGEATGHLEENLDRVAEIRAHRTAQRRLLITRSLYPIVLFHAAAICMPAASLGLQSKLTFDAYFSRVFVTLGIAYGLAFAVWLLSHSPAWRARWRIWLDRIPGFGNAARHERRARFATVLCAAYNSGLQLDRAVSLAGRSAHFPAAQAVASISEGKSLTDSIAPLRIFDIETLSRISTGEVSGDLSKTFSTIATEEFAVSEQIYTRAMMILGNLLYGAMALWIVIFVISFYMKIYGPVLDMLG